MATAVAPHISKEKKKLVRRVRPDRSQRIRHIVQGAFLVLNAWLGMQFYLWVRFYERGATGLYVSRPAGAEGWLPIAGLMNTEILLCSPATSLRSTRRPCSSSSSFLLMSVLLKKAFCSWLCPVGTFSEFLADAGRRIFGRNFRLPRWLDIPLRGLKVRAPRLLRLPSSASCLPRRSTDFMQTPLRPHGRRQNAQLLPPHEPHRGHRHRPFWSLLSVLVQTFLVPLSLPLRRAASAWRRC